MPPNSNADEATSQDHPFRALAHVDDLAAHLPFDASAPKLYADHDSHGSELDYETRAFAYVRRLLLDDGVSLIVLTGDTGHGKTHLCRRLLQHGGLSAEDALTKICTDDAGRDPIELPGAKRAVRIIKDLSEFELDGAAQLLIGLLDDESTIGIVSANEGRLRAVTHRRPEQLSVILDTLDGGLAQGDTADASGKIHVINLNFQAAAPIDEQRGFLRYLLDAWTSDGRKWRSCTTCKAKPDCPIIRNRERLSGRGSRGEAWRDGLVQLIRTAEQTGYVLTFRETLILIAYLLTGGLRCADVERLVLRKRPAELDNHHLERLLFEVPLDERKAEQLRVLMRMRRYDPGLVPHRDVDEAIIERLEDDDVLGGAAWFGAAGIPHTRKQLRDEAADFAELVRSKRREAYFEVAAQGPTGIFQRARRLGLHHYDRFDHIQGADESHGAMKPIIAQVIAGLHVIQGIRPPDTTELYIVDPAFSRAGSGTAVIAARLRRNKLWLRGLHEFWQDKKGGATPPLTEAVDWLDRVIVLRDEHNNALLELDLMQFEFILRAGEGVAFAAFHAAERRRVLTKLAQLAERLPRRADTIQIVVADTIREVLVDRDGSIEVPERSL